MGCLVDYPLELLHPYRQNMVAVWYPATPLLDTTLAHSSSIRMRSDDESRTSFCVDTSTDFFTSESAFYVLLFDYLFDAYDDAIKEI